MPLLASDIVYVLSGGVGNLDASTSTGGEPSAIPIPTGINNLFDDVTPDQSVAGFVDYRCIYVFNDSGDQTFHDVVVYVPSETPSGASILIGLPTTNEVQTVTVSGTYSSSGGNFVLTYETTNFTVPQSPDFPTWVAAFQAAMRGVPTLEDVTVSGQVFTLAKVFSITYLGEAGRRSQPLLTLNNNNLGGSSIITFGRSMGGTPINQVTPDTGSVTVAPSGVNFTSPTSTNPIFLGSIRPLEGFPIWVKRMVEPGAAPLALDSFKLRVSGSGTT
jgi:hypothetical protein